MLKRLLNGFLFGVGFAVAIILVFWVYSYTDISVVSGIVPTSSEKESWKEQIEWQELSYDEKIKAASAVILVRFNETEDRYMEAYVENILQKDHSPPLPYAIGDRVEDEDYYAEGGITRNRDGVIVVFSGNPPNKLGSLFIYDDRLVGLGGMPLEVFYRKFDDSPAGK